MKIFHNFILGSRLIIPFKNISARRRIKKSYRISWICQIHTIFKRRGRRRNIFQFCTHPWVHYFLMGKVKTRNKSEAVISSSKSYGKTNTKLKESVCQNSHTRYEKRSMSQPHKGGGIIVKLFAGDTNFIQPTLGCNIRFLDFFILKEPAIYQDTRCQVHKHRCKQITKISNRQTDHKTQKNAFIPIKEGASCCKIVSNWLSLLCHWMSPFCLQCNIVFFEKNPINSAVNFLPMSNTNGKNSINFIFKRANCPKIPYTITSKFMKISFKGLSKQSRISRINHQILQVIKNLPLNRLIQFLKFLKGALFKFKTPNGHLLTQVSFQHPWQSNAFPFFRKQQGQQDNLPDSPAIAQSPFSHSSFYCDLFYQLDFLTDRLILLKFLHPT